VRMTSYRSKRFRASERFASRQVSRDFSVSNDRLA
jgi:hypothetical protein